MASVRVWQKQQIRLDRLNFDQNQMFKIGNVGVAAVKTRVAAALGPTDGPAKPLTKRYAIWKSKLGAGNKRNLTLSGDMLRNFQIRTVSENKAKGNVTGRSTIKTIFNKRERLVGVENRVKAWANQKREEWMVFSPKNKAAVVEATRRVMAEAAKRLVLKKTLGGKQQ